MNRESRQLLTVLIGWAMFGGGAIIMAVACREPIAEPVMEIRDCPDPAPCPVCDTSRYPDPKPPTP